MNDQHENDQAIDAALKQLIAEQVNNALQAFVNRLPTIPPTPPPNNIATIENPRSGLANSGSGGTPSKSRDGGPGKFLGFLVSNRGIQVNPAQIKAIEEIPDILTSKKKVQRLTGRITALGRFISKSSEKSFNFFSVLKKQSQFEWTEECQQALKNIKAYLSNPPLLAKPKDGEKLLIYLAVSEVAVSAVLVREDRDFSPGMVTEAEKEQQVFNVSNPGTWTLFTDGSSNVKGARFRIGTRVRIEQVIVKSNSQLVVNQMQGTYIGRKARMQQYSEKAQHLVTQFQTWKIVQIPKDENVEADALANLASAAEVTNEDNASYGILPEDKKKAQSLRRKAARYYLDRGNLYRKMFGVPLARCLGPSQTEYVMIEIHEGHCGNHAGGRSLIAAANTILYTSAPALFPAAFFSVY
ncbi:PREDICTED: uncharacterized protein LOC109241444 [Nicotiana attenuata]|uniref:uncharacterized protein LOC109241444 n=1 Tax=Nicotiana attenuata TaxID=49451 RepID=UPI000904EDE9|nr:PREDICTED: uncharacterized protein LOC109241444 [Nicotiana attenuata]